MASNTTARQDEVIKRADQIGSEVPVCQELIGIIDDLDNRLSEALAKVDELTPQ